MDRKIMVLLHPQRHDARQAALLVCANLRADGVQPVMLAEEYATLVAHCGQPETPITVIGEVELVAVRDLIELVIVLGGDGTILRAAERFHGSQAPLMGINLGHVGFLAEGERDELAEAVHRASARDYTVDERMAIDVRVWLGDEEIHRTWALNEATVEKSENSRMIEVVLGVDARPVSSFGCDGVILATPTGSTAYAFSAGGPIVWPEVEALLMLPISAHALFTKPLVTNPNSRLGVELVANSQNDTAVLWCDGRREYELPARARVEVTRSTSPIKLARLGTGNFTDRLVAKFHLPVHGWRGPVSETAALPLIDPQTGRPATSHNLPGHAGGAYNHSGHPDASHNLPGHPGGVSS